MNIGIYLYDNAEVLDFSGPFEVFSTAIRLVGRGTLTNVYLIAEHIRPVRARGGFSIIPHFCIEEHPPIDVLVVVGGDHTEEVTKQPIIDWVARTAASAQLTASVCTGAFILAEAGLLDGLEVTTHWEDIPDLGRNYPALTVKEGVRWVDQGHIITSGGISAGIDMSLHILSRLTDQKTTLLTAKQMEFEWRKGKSHGEVSSV